MVVIVNEVYQVNLDIYLLSKLLYLTVLGKWKYLFYLILTAAVKLEMVTSNTLKKTFLMINWYLYKMLTTLNNNRTLVF